MKRHIFVAVTIFICWTGIANAQDSASTGQLSRKTAFSGEMVGEAPPPQELLSLWYRKPAGQWVEALPIGNGRLGAMVFGGVCNERLQLNEDTLWAGGPYEPSNPKGKEALPVIRQMIFEGNYAQAHKLVDEGMMGRPPAQMLYETVGDLLLSFGDIQQVENYRRDLNLDTAIACTSYTADGVTFQREVFSSPIDQVIVMRLTADKPGKISFTAGMKTPQKATVKTSESDTLVIDGINGSAFGVEGVLKFQARVKILAQNGQITPGADTIGVSNADSATLLIAIATAYKNYKDISGDPQAITEEQIARACKKTYESMRQEHIAEHQRLFRRVSLDLGSTDQAKLPTDIRIQNSESSCDPRLAVLYFQFGRYLLISCSRPGCQPANLQGLWNEAMDPPWGSKYTININTEMNYWPAEPTNLGECVEPLIAMLKDLRQTGAKTAKVTWDANGWCCHHNTDLWRATAPIDGANYGMWPTGGAWLCKHLWDHYEYNGDKTFLAQVYPIMKEAAQFFLDTLIDEPTHKWLVTSPSSSPEIEHPKGVHICAGPTMDMQIIRDLFTNCIDASEILGTDGDFRSRLEAARSRLAPNQIGSAGQLQEFLEDWDMQIKDIHHRHVSHLYALYPSDQINIFEAPDLAAAAKKSLEIRGDEATGWGIGWRLNLWARLHDGEHAYKILRMLLRPSRTYPNMFDAHPPFQIDGNFGGTAGIAEMLMHSRASKTENEKTWEMEFLPALPAAFPNGSVTGLRAKGGFEVDIEWKDCKLVRAKVRSLLGNPCSLRYGDIVRQFNLKQREEKIWTGQQSN